MRIPDQQDVMLPLLVIAADGKKHHLREAISSLADQLKLTKREREEMLPSGLERVFDNRVWWARTYLKKAGLLEYPGRGQFKITPRGRRILAQQVDSINVPLLRKYPEFADFCAHKNRNQSKRSLQ